MLSLSEVLQDRFLKADEGDPSHLVELGLTLPLIREIQNAPLKKRNHFCKLSGMYLGKVLYQELSTVSCQKRLKEILLYVDREDPDDWRLDELLRQGATATLMRDAFGITKDEFTVRRKLLKVSDAGGRPRQVTRHQEAAILKSWSQSTGLPLVQRFLRVAQESKLDLKRIWPVLRPALGLPETRRGPHPKRPPRLGARVEPLAATGQQA